MFGSKDSKKEQGNKKVSVSSAASPTSNSINAIVSGTFLDGKIKANNDFRIDGNLVGSLDCAGKVIIGPTGQVEGEIICANALIEGKFDGKLKVKELLSVKDSAKITGDVVTDKLLVQSGALFNVSCQMGVKSGGGSSSNHSNNKQAKKDFVLNA